MARRAAAEFLGTFALVFAGAGAIIINDETGGAISHLGIAITFGLVVMTIIYAIGDVSGAHINPAVTLGFVAAGRFPLRSVVPYVTAQCLGAALAAISLRALFLDHPTLGLTLPAGSSLQSFVLEVLLTLFLMFVILSVSTGAKEKGIMAGVAVGAVVGLCAVFAGPVSGASMNPARSLGPAVTTRQLGFLWIYLTAPVLGALLAVPACRAIHGRDCCPAKGARAE